jgi:hypothetical protein
LDTATDEAGSFEFAVPELGTYRLSVTPLDLAAHVVAPIRVREDTDLGALEILPGASVAGQVLVPPGVDPGGLTVHLGTWRSTVTTTTRADGTFSFEGIPVGTQLFTLGSRAGVLEGGAEATIDLGSGEAHEVLLDARGFGMCQVTLLVDLGGTPTDGVQIDLVPVEGFPTQLRLGNLDAEGRVSGSARALGDVRVGVWLKGLGQVFHPSTVLTLTYGTPVEAPVTFEFGGLRCFLPAGIPWPEKATLRLTLQPQDEGPVWATRAVLRNGRSENGEDPAVDGILFELVSVGAFDTTLLLQDDAAEALIVDLGEGRSTVERPTLWSATVPTDIAPGSVRELRLR